LTGYCINRERRLSPWMALDLLSAERLLQAVLSSAEVGRPAAVVPSLNGPAMQLLGRYGFAFTRSCRHMQRGALLPRLRTMIYGQVSYAIG